MPSAPDPARRGDPHKPRRFPWANRALVALATAVGLGGCAAPGSKPLLPAETQSRFDARRLDDADLRHFLAAHGQPAAGEWDLDRLTLAAFHFQPRLDQARARLAEAEAAARAAGELPNPTFTFTPGYNTEAGAGVSPWILGYALNLPIELAGKRGHRLASAQHQIEAARLALASEAWAVRRAVRRALLEVRSADRLALLWRDLLPSYRDVAALVERQVSAGETAPLEASQARLALQQAETAARAHEAALVTARSQLAEAIGVPLAALSGVQFSDRGLAASGSAPAGAEARAWAARNRADLLAELATYAAAHAALQAEAVRTFADLSLGPAYDFDQGEGKWSLALSVTVPLFHRNQGPIAEALARRETAAARFLSRQSQVLAEVDRALAHLAQVPDDLHAAGQLQQETERLAQRTAVQYRAGEISRLDVLRAQIGLAEHRRAEIDLRLRTEQAIGDFEDAVQRPLAWPETSWRATSRPRQP
ncbi:MAG: TolC family protein [Verrucomicrobia bacterium]|nr:TolC family protein [Verrucomicrobiota bacterium]